MGKHGGIWSANFGRRPLNYYESKEKTKGILLPLAIWNVFDDVPWLTTT